MATQDLDILSDINKLRAFTTKLRRTDAKSMIGVLRKADPTFRVLQNKLETAANDSGFEVDIIRRTAIEGDPHPFRMSERPGRDPLKAPKDRLQADVVRQIWDGYLEYSDAYAQEPSQAAMRPSEAS